MIRMLADVASLDKALGKDLPEHRSRMLSLIQVYLSMPMSLFQSDSKASN